MNDWLIGIEIYLFIGFIYGLFDLFHAATSLPIFAWKTWKRTYLNFPVFYLLIAYTILWFPNAAHRIYYWVRFKITGERHEF